MSGDLARRVVSVLGQRLSRYRRGLSSVSQRQSSCLPTYRQHLLGLVRTNRANGLPRRANQFWRVRLQGSSAEPMLWQTKSACGIRLGAMLFCVACISLPLAAQSSPAGVRVTDFQSWDELDALTRLTPHLDVTWIARVRLSTELPNPTHYLFGTDWNFSVRTNCDHADIHPRQADFVRSESFRRQI